MRLWQARMASPSKLRGDLLQLGGHRPIACYCNNGLHHWGISLKNRALLAVFIGMH